MPYILSCKCRLTNKDTIIIFQALLFTAIWGYNVMFPCYNFIVWTISVVECIIDMKANSVCVRVFFSVVFPGCWESSGSEPSTRGMNLNSSRNKNLTLQVRRYRKICVCYTKNLSYTYISTLIVTKLIYLSSLSSD